MENDDTLKLLRECNAGIKMGVSSIDEVMPSVKDPKLKKTLELSRHEHGVLGDETHDLLLQCGGDTKEPHPIAKGMSRVKTNVKLQMGSDDKVVADIMTDGCNMGIKSINKYLNQYSTANNQSKEICKKLIRLMDNQTFDMRKYL